MAPTWMRFTGAGVEVALEASGVLAGEDQIRRIEGRLDGRVDGDHRDEQERGGDFPEADDEEGGDRHNREANVPEEATVVFDGHASHPRELQCGESHRVVHLRNLRGPVEPDPRMRRGLPKEPRSSAFECPYQWSVPGPFPGSFLWPNRLLPAGPRSAVRTGPIPGSFLWPNRLLPAGPRSVVRTGPIPRFVPAAQPAPTRRSYLWPAVRQFPLPAT